MLAANHQLSPTHSLYNNDMMSVTTHSHLTANCPINIPTSTRSNGGVLQRRLPQIPSPNISLDQKLPENDLLEAPRLPLNAERRYIMANRRFDWVHLEFLETFSLNKLTFRPNCYCINQKLIFAACLWIQMKKRNGAGGEMRIDYKMMRRG